MRAEIAQATRENKTFLKNVERAKMVENMEAKKRKRQAEAEHDRADEEGGVKLDAAPASKKEKKVDVRRTFRQNETAGKGHTKVIENKKERSENVGRVLKKIF